MKIKHLMLMCSLTTANIASASSFHSDTFKTPEGEDLIVTCIKHGGLVLTYDNHSIQIDPVSELKYGIYNE